MRYIQRSKGTLSERNVIYIENELAVVSICRYECLRDNLIQLCVAIQKINNFPFKIDLYLQTT